MNVRRSVYQRNTACLVLGLILLVGCRRRTRLWPSDQDFTDRSIVFEMPLAASDHNALGFINPDGTGLTARAFGSGFYGAMPTWAPDGRYIAVMTRSGLSASYFNPYRPAVISNEGELLADCPNWEWNDGRVQINPEGLMVLTLNLAEEKRERVVLADFFSCEILDTLYEATGMVDEELLVGADLSIDGWLAVSRSFQHGCPVEVETLIIDPVSHEVSIVGSGMAPAWSPDGQRLAFSELDGIYVIGKSESESRKIVDLDSRREPCDGYGWFEGVPAPSWSPDGEWLVYHRLTANGPLIVKVNTESGEEVEIFKGGIYPDWLWASSDD